MPGVSGKNLMTLPSPAEKTWKGLILTVSCHSHRCWDEGGGDCQVWRTAFCNTRRLFPVPPACTEASDTEPLVWGLGDSSGLKVRLPASGWVDRAG